jgi:hypothetical protein
MELAVNVAIRYVLFFPSAQRQVVIRGGSAPPRIAALLPALVAYLLGTGNSLLRCTDADTNPFASFTYQPRTIFSRADRISHRHLFLFLCLLFSFLFPFLDLASVFCIRQAFSVKLTTCST